MGTFNPEFRPKHKDMCSIQDQSMIEQLVKILPVDINYNKLREEVAYYFTPTMRKAIKRTRNNYGLITSSGGAAVTNLEENINKPVAEIMRFPIGRMAYFYDLDTHELIEKRPHTSWTSYPGPWRENISSAYVTGDRDGTNRKPELVCLDKDVIHWPAELANTEIKRVAEVLNDYLEIDNKYRVRLSYVTNGFVHPHADMHTPYRVQIQLSGSCQWRWTDFNTDKYCLWDQPTDAASLVRTQIRHEVNVGAEEERMALFYQIYNKDLPKMGWYLDRDGSLFK